MTKTTKTTSGDETLTRLLVCNGIDATTGEYLLPPIDVRELARLATGVQLDGPELSDLRNKKLQAFQANFAVVEGVDANDLAQAGWAVVFPATEAGSEVAARQAAIRDALAPLLTHRRAVAGALYREYAGELGYQAGETKQQYLARLGAGTGPAQPKNVPYYLLLVATPEEIPFRIQYQLDVQYAVGRIAFDTVEEYACYAHSVVDAETGRAARPRRTAFFGVANPNDAATQLSADHLILPLAEYVEGRAQHGFTVDRHLGDAATHGRLTELLGDAPALLFTASHGMGFPAGAAGQRERQGAILCQDWGGPGTPVAREHYFAGEDIPAGADLRGMIGVLFACYGGGTPTHDDFTRRALGPTQAKQLAPTSLLARLPQRLLGHPGGGALAVVAHVDRAWGSAFLWMDPKRQLATQRHLSVFEDLLDRVLDGKRLGYAMEAFNLRYAELAADLNERIQEIQGQVEHCEDAELAELGHMWICNNDARNYAVIGDPAVRIPRAEEAQPVHPAPMKRPDVRARKDDPMIDDTRPAAQDDLTGPVKPAEIPSFPIFSKSDNKGDSEPGALARLTSRVSEVLTEMFNDAAVLEVKTYTSENLQAIADGQPLSAAGARLRAYTKCKLDGDTEVVVPVASGGAIDEALWTLHLEMVKQAQAHRAELLKTVLSLFSSRVGK